ncbi:hypothetical protein KIPB_012247, partial [Kipferlia bialata]
VDQASGVLRKQLEVADARGTLAQVEAYIARQERLSVVELLEQVTNQETQLNAQSSEAEGALAVLSNRKKEADQECTQAEQHAMHERQEMKTHRVECAQIRAKASGYTKQVTAQSAKKKKLDTSIRQAEATLEELPEQVAATEASRDQAEAQRVQAQERHMALLAEVDRASGKDGVSGREAELGVALANLKEECATLQAQVAEAEKEK